MPLPDGRGALWDYAEAVKEAQARLSELDEERAGITPRESGGMYEFLGQMTWGAAEAITLGGLEISDIVEESMGGEKDRMEKKFTSLGGLQDSYEGDFGELSGWGKSGYTVGQILGSLPTFMFGGAIAGKVISTTGKIGSIGTKALTKKATRELVDFGTKTLGTAGTKGAVKTIDDDIAEGIIKESMDFMTSAESKSTLKELKKIGGKRLAEGAFQNAAKLNIKASVGKALNIASDNKLLTQYADEVYRIIVNNNPNNGLNVALGLGTSLFGNKAAGMIAGAMAYDASMGFVLGAARGLVDYQTREFHYAGTDKETPKGYFNQIMKDVFMESAVMSILGPIQYFKGGSGASLTRTTYDTFRGMLRGMVPLGRMNQKALEANASFLYNITNNTIGQTLKHKGVYKWANKGTGDDWIKGASKEDLREFIKAARVQFLKEAPGKWAVEFGAEMIYSLPRMAAGTLAMNLPGIYQVANEYGIENWQLALGETPSERISNIIQGMYFTRKPHTFHTVNKIRGFNTEELRRYASRSGEDLAKAVGSLRTMGVKDLDIMNRNLGMYSQTMSDDGIVGNLDNKMKNYVLENSQNMRDLENLYKEVYNQTDVGNEPLYAGLRTAAAKYNSINNKTMEERDAYSKKVEIALEIVDFYEGRNFANHKIDNASMTAEQANNMVEALYNMKFGGKNLGANPKRELSEWYADLLKSATQEPLTNIRSFVQEVYRELGLVGSVDDKGILTLDLLDYSVKNSEDTVFFNNLNQAVRQLEALGIVKRADTRHQRVDLTVDQINKAKKVFERHIDTMHEYVYGKNWVDSGIGRDENILKNPSWYIPYRRLQNISRTKDFISLLTGDNLEPNTTLNKISLDLKDLIKVRDALTLTTTDDVPPKEFEKASKFLKRLQSLVVLSNPRLRKAANDKEKEVDFSKVMSIKNDIDKRLGDILMNDTAFKTLESSLLDYSLDTLGLADAKFGYNMKLGLHSLFTDPTFIDSEGFVVLPDVNTLESFLHHKLQSKEITSDTYKELLDYVSDIHNVLLNSNLGFVQVRSNLKSEDSWIEALKLSKIRSQMMPGEKAARTVRDTIEELGGIATVLQQRLDDLDLMSSEALDIKKRNIKEAEIDEALRAILRKNLKMNNAVMNEMKSAYANRNTLFIHSLMNYQAEYNKILKVLRNPSTDDNTITNHIEKLVRLNETVRNRAIDQGMKEATFMENVQRAVNKNEGSIHERDVHGHNVKVSISQFSLRYDIDQSSLFDIINTYKDPVNSSEELRRSLEHLAAGHDINDPAVRTWLDSLKNMQIADEASMQQFVIDSLLGDIKLKQQFYKDVGIDRLNVSDSEILGDIHSMLTSVTSTKPFFVATYQNGRLLVESKPFADAPNRGHSGLVNTFSAYHGDILILSSKNIVNGKVVDGITKDFLAEFEKANNEGEGIGFLEEKRGIQNAVFEGDLRGVNKSRQKGRPKYKIIDAGDESTTLIIRVDEDSILHNTMKNAYSKDGELRKQLEDYGVTAGSQLKQFLDSIDRTIAGDGLISDKNLEYGIKLARVIKDRPDMINDFANPTEGAISRLRKAWKYLKLTQPKGGFIGSDANLERAGVMLKKMADLDKSGYYRNIYNIAKPWIEKKGGKYRKLKVLSIADERETFGGGRVNIFSSIERQKVYYRDLKNKGKIDKDELEYNEKLYDELAKSIVDGEFIISKEAYITSLAMMGAANKRTITFDDQGNIKEIKAGGIKPQVTNVDYDPSTGRTRVFYAKTAFKYRPEFDNLLKDLKVDGITFKSANKVNEFKPGSGRDWLNSDIDKPNINDPGQDTYASVKGVDPGHQDLDKNLIEWLSEKNAGGGLKNIRYRDSNISHIPFSAINLRSAGVSHDPLVSNNLGVHMKHDNGIKEWIGLENKIDIVGDSFSKESTDIYYRTRLGRDLFGYSSELGDMSFVNSGMDFVMANDGLITDQWMRLELNEKIIPYYMNNGSIAGGRVPEGSVDIMSADVSGMSVTGKLQQGLKVPVRSFIESGDDVLPGFDGGNRKTQKYFGDFLASYSFASKKFKRFGGKDKINLLGKSRGNIGSVIMHDVSYSLKKGSTREAHGYMVPIGKFDGKPILIVEGIGINKDGEVVDLSTGMIMKDAIGSNSKDVNKKAYEAVKNRDEEIDSIYESKGGDLTYGEMAESIYIKFGNENAIGVINVRQPRNQVGDIVLNRMKVFADQGNIITSNGKESGNLSTINYVDAIHPQDADFDMDKSTVFGASTGKFWSEVGRLAGYDSVGSNEQLEMLFNKVAMGTEEAPHIYDEGKWKRKINEVDKARGRFVKMHQTMTYLVNMFEGRNIATIKGDKGYDYIVKINKWNQNYLNTVDNLAGVVKLYLDMYKVLPPEQAVSETQKNILFGEKGMFDIYKQDRKDGSEVLMDRSKINLLKDFRLETDTLFDSFIKPINRYLTLNRGTTVDENNKQNAATLDDYSYGYQSLNWALDPKEKIKGDIDMRAGYASAYKYINSDSQAPFDVAMKGLYDIHSKQVAMRNDVRDFGMVKNMVKFIQEGTVPDEYKQEVAANSHLADQIVTSRLAQKAFGEYVKDESKLFELEVIASRIGSLDYKIDYIKRVDKNFKENAEYIDLAEKRNRAIEIKTMIEESVSYLKNQLQARQVYLKKGYKKAGEWKNDQYAPVVVIKRGDKKPTEVIMPGKRNTRDINPEKDKLLVNGKRYEVVRGDDHLALEATFGFMAGQHVYVHPDGSRERLRLSEMKIINDEFIDLKEKITNEWKNLPDKSTQSIAEYSALRMNHIVMKLNESFFANSPARREAFFWRLMRPEMDNSVIAVSPYKGVGIGTQATLGPKFIENKYSKLAYQVLSQMANNKVKTPHTVTAAEAKKIMKDITENKTIAMHEMKSGKFNIEKRESRSHTLPVDFELGYMRKDTYLNKGVYENLNSQNANLRNSARLMVDYMEGNKEASGVELYMASKFLEEKIPINELYTKEIKSDISKGGKKIGIEYTTSPISDRFRREKMGVEGTVVDAKAEEVIKNMASCILGN